jgi:pimeloyl-ACP methyl ester carboxylesterase
MVPFALAALSPIVSYADVTLASGVRMHYAQQGPRVGPTLILLHGYSDSWFSFSRVMPLLPLEFRVIAPDFRGHGSSDRPESGYRIDDLAGDIVELMEALSVPSAIIVGHSMGSFVAQAIADRVPTRVTGLVLMGSAPVAANATVSELRLAVSTLTDPVDAEFVRAFQFGTVALPVPDTFMDAAIRNSRRMPARVWQEALTGLFEYRPAAKRPTVRTLVLGGKKDSVFSAAEQTQLARQYPNSRLQLIDDVGHSLHWEQPDVFVRALMRFIW